MLAIEESGSLASNPNYQMGYGIPDYVYANSILTIVDNLPSEDSFITVYPNPFSSELFISTEDNIIDVYSVELMDITGKLLFYKDISNNENNRETIVISGFDELSSGFYFVRISTRDKVISKKILKN